MKTLLYSSAFCFLFFITPNLSAQVQGHYKIIVQDTKGEPIMNAKLIVLSGEEYFTKADGSVIYYGEEDYVYKNKKYVKIRSLPHYITAKAPYYKDRTIDLTKYKIGSAIVVQLERLPVQYKSISVFVKNTKGEPVDGAYLLVTPGKSAHTDGSGFAEALHTQMIGEWVKITVSADGYKTQTQHIPTGDASRMEGNKVIPPATAYFTLEPGSNESTIFHINVEVLDHDSDRPVPGAQVKLNISDGTIQSGSTNGNGEVMFSDLEFSYKGTTAKVIVNKPGYIDAWSEITADMMTGLDNPVRQFVVYMKKDKTVCWPGSHPVWNAQTQKSECFCDPGLVWNSTKTACIDPKDVGAKGCNTAGIETFSKMTGSWKSYRMHVTISGSCDKVTGTWKVTEWCEGVDETYNASVARINGTLNGKMDNGYLQLSFESPPSPNNSKGTKGMGSCRLNSDGTLSCSGFGCSSDPLKKQ